MQNNASFCYSCHQENSGLHHPRGAPVNSAISNITSMSTYATASVNLAEWSPAVAPIIGNSDRPLTSSPAAAEIFGRVERASCHQIALGRGSPSPLANCDYFTEACSRPWWPAGQPSTAHAHVPPETEGRVTHMQRDGSHTSSVTTDQDAFTELWSHGGDPHHAVAAPTQPASLRDADHLPHPLPAWLYTATSPDVTDSSTTQTHMPDSSGISSWMANAVIGHAPSSPNRRQYHRRRPYASARLERVACDKCKKPMRRQSLRRHIREVHDHIKRGHAQSTFPAGPQ